MVEAARDPAMTRKGELQKDELIEAAIELFAAKGYAGTSIRDIAKLTDRSVSNVYHYFEDKEALWLEILKYSVQGVPEKLRNAASPELPPLDRFRALLQVHLVESVRHRKEAKIFFIDEERLSPMGKKLNKQIQKEIFDIYHAELRQLQAAGLIRSPNVRILSFNVLGVINWHLRWQDRVSGFPIEEVHEQVIDFIMNGLRVERQR